MQHILDHALDAFEEEAVCWTTLNPVEFRGKDCFPALHRPPGQKGPSRLQFDSDADRQHWINKACLRAALQAVGLGED